MKMKKKDTKHPSLTQLSLFLSLFHSPPFSAPNLRSAPTPPLQFSSLSFLSLSNPNLAFSPLPLSSFSKLRSTPTAKKLDFFKTPLQFLGFWHTHPSPEALHASGVVSR